MLFVFRLIKHLIHPTSSQPKEKNNHTANVGLTSVHRTRAGGRVNIRKKTHTLEAFVVETDLAKELLLGATGFGGDSLPSDEGKRGVPGGVRSLISKQI